MSSTGHCLKMTRAYVSMDGHDYWSICRMTIPAQYLEGSGAFYFTVAGAVLFFAVILSVAFLAGRFSR